MAEATQLFLNPQGNCSRDGRHWMASQRVCLRELAPAEVTVVESAEEAAQAAKEAALQGFRKLVSVGDMATAHGVVNGIMELAEGHRRRLKVGFLSLSRPDQWSRTLDLPRRLGRQLEILSAGHTLPYDVGRVDFEGPEGGRLVRHFLNGASFGVTGHVKREWRDPRTNLLQALGRIAEALREGTTRRGTHVRLESGGEVLYEGVCAVGMVMGGRYYPAFGHVAPQADPTDGLLELAWLGGEPWWSLSLKLAGLWMGSLRPRGAHLHWQSVERLSAVALDGPVYVEVDGQPIGLLPATFSVVPRALPVMVAPVAVKLRKPAFKPVEKFHNGRLVGNIKSAAGL